METQNSRFKIGFTLVEMMTVLAVIMILAALLLPVLAKTRARAIRTQCLNNFKQVDLLFLMYGHENNDRLPQTTSLTTLPPPLVEMVNRGRVPPRIFYDPGIEDQSSNWYGPNVFSPTREIGYCLTLPGITSLHASNVNATILPQPILMVSGASVLLPPPNASERVLIAGGTWPGSGIPNNAHVDSKDFPLGDNVAMLDGSARWRRFKDMTGRLSKASGGPEYGIRW
jgi:type II secretory pathway pseudopilin PulG